MTTRLITPDELIEAPTGFDWNDIAESIGATTAIEAVEQLRIIDRASNWACRYVFNSSDARLDATSDTELRRIGPGLTNCWVERNGALVFRTTFFPVLTVTALSWATEVAGNPSPQFNALDPTKALIFGEGTRKRRIIDTSQDWSFLRMGGQISATYVNGWPNAVLTSAVAAGSGVSLPIDTSLGYTATPGPSFIGGTATIYDGANSENVTVASVPDATHIVASSLSFPHPAGVGVSALPPELKWGVILACLHFGRIRGTDAVTYVDHGSARTTSLKEESDALSEAEAFLDPFKVFS